MTAAEDRKPILVVVAGANGSGKTTLTTQLLQAAQYVADERERALAAHESIAFETVFSSARPRRRSSPRV